MGLEIQTTGALDYGQYMKVLVCGPAGAGKTLFSSTFPNPIFASAEGGLMSVARRNVKFAKISSPGDLKQLLGYLEQDPDVREKFFKGPVETVVIDTIDEIQKLLIRERLAAKRIETLDMQGWGWLGDQMRLILTNFRNLDMNVVFTCHLKETSDQTTGQVFFKPALQGGVGDEVANYMDLSLLLRTKLGTRVGEGNTSERYMERFLQTYKDGQHDWIKDRSGQLPQEFAVNFEDDYDRMYSAIFGYMEPAIKAAQAEGRQVLQQIEEDTASETVETPEADASVPETEVPVKGGATSPIPIGQSEAQTFTCEECKEPFDDVNQHDLSMAILRKSLDKDCYATLKNKK